MDTLIIKKCRGCDTFSGWKCEICEHILSSTLFKSVKIIKCEKCKVYGMVHCCSQYYHDTIEWSNDECDRIMKEEDNYERNVKEENDKIQKKYYYQYNDGK